MNQLDGSDPFGVARLTPLLAHIETGEKQLEALESKYISVIKELDEINQQLKQFNKKATETNIRNLHYAVKKLSKGQIYDLHFLLGFYAQRQSWISPKEIAEAGKKHSSSVVKKNLIGQDQQHRSARGTPAIRDLCESKKVNGKRMFRPKGLIAEFAISYFYLRKCLNLISDVMLLLEDFQKFNESLNPYAVQFLQIGEESHEKLKPYAEDIPKSVQKTIEKLALIRKITHDAMSQYKRKEPASPLLRQLNNAIKYRLEEIRNSSQEDIIRNLKALPLECAKEIFDSCKQDLKQCKAFLQLCKFYIELQVKDRDLNIIKIELNSMKSQFSDIVKMMHELETNYRIGKITKVQYEKQHSQIDKIMDKVGKRVLRVLRSFDLKRVLRTTQ